LTMKYNLEPVLARGIGPVVRGSIVPIIIIAQYLCLTMIIPAANQPKKALGTALWALTGSTVIGINHAGCSSNMGPDQGSRLVFPFLSMVRAIYISVFLERVEMFALFAWGFGIFIAVSVFMYCCSRALSQVLGLSDYRPLIGPLRGNMGNLRSALVPGYVPASDILSTQDCRALHPCLDTYTHGYTVGGLRHTPPIGR
jgi:spore germination protein KB